MKRPLFLLGSILLLAGCSETAPTDTGPQELQPPPEGKGFQLTFEATVPPASEAWICDVYQMPNTGFANVNRVEVEQTPGTHHLTLSTLGLTGDSNLKHGRYDCNELYGDSSLMEDQIMFFGNQGSATDVMQLPEGVAAQLPGSRDVIHEMHFVNTTKEEISLYSRVNAWTIPADEVVEGIWGGNIRDEHINIGPKSEHTEWSRCVFNEDVEVLFLASHMHALGREFKVSPFDGKTTGEPIYSNTDWHVPLITQYEPGITVKAGEGFEWSCTWKNPGDEEVTYGPTATDEMCNLSIVHTPFSTTAECKVVETSDGVLWEKGD